MSVCVNPDCDRPTKPGVAARRLCRACYARAWRAGTLNDWARMREDVAYSGRWVRDGLVWRGVES